MQGGRGGRQGLFGFGDPSGGSGGFGQPGSLMPGFFGGANPFDDPFFTNPFGSMMQTSFSAPFSGMMQPSFMNPFGSMVQPSLLGPSMFAPHGNLNGGMFGSQTHLSQGISNGSGFIQQAPEPSRSKGPIIKELSSDDEDDVDDDEEGEKKNGNFRKHQRESKEPYVEDPDDEEDNKRPKHGQFGREFSRDNTSRPQPQTFMFQSSTVTYGGPNGACYTSSTTRRTGADGFTLEENKEADTTTGKATHRISRGIGIKGHSLTRNLNSGGRVNTLQTLHNLNEDELAGFEESWQRNTRENMPGWDPRMNMLGSGNVRSDFRDVNQMPALPAPELYRGTNFQNGSSMGRAPRT